MTEPKLACSLDDYCEVRLHHGVTVEHCRGCPALQGGPKMICLNRHEVRERTFSCSQHGQLVDIICCRECMQKASETESQKIEREITLNDRLIAYYRKEAETVEGENCKLRLRLLRIREVEKK